MNIYERIKRFLNNSDKPIIDDWNAIEPKEGSWPFVSRWSNTRRYKIAMVYTKWRTIVSIVVDSEEDEIELEQNENFIKWISSWIEVKL